MRSRREKILARVRALPPEGQDRFYEFAFAMQRSKATGTLWGLVAGVVIGVAMCVYCLIAG